MVVENAASVPARKKVGFTSSNMLADWGLAAAVFAGVTAIRLFVVHLLADAKGIPLDRVLTRWDAVHYIGVANGGYFENMDPNALDGYQARLAFFPLFPLLLRTVREVTGLDFLGAALLVNAIAGTAMVAAVIAIARYMGAGTWGAAAAGVLLAGAPMSLTYNMPYTEALFAAFAYWALWAMLSHRWVLAGGLVFFTCLTRITGVDLWLVFFIAVIVYALKDWRAWLGVVLSPLGMVAYLLFANSYTADVGGYFGLQEKGWGSAFDFGVASLDFLSWAFNRNSDSWLIVVGLAMIVAALSVVLTFRKVPWLVWLFAAGVTANVLLSDGTITSRPRLLLPAIICLLPLAIGAARSFDRLRLALLAVSWVVFGAVISVHPLIATVWAI
ncbi:hypothetical protein WG936_03695 [Corynebacterium sp. H127]|uniref:hypothetical protein n=1 Tax=Corynebacterium sp. H127 TaxID=3133418 RepID=UPI0030B328FA